MVEQVLLEIKDAVVEEEPVLLAELQPVQFVVLEEMELQYQLLVHP
jgi:hypothetical protein